MNAMATMLQGRPIVESFRQRVREQPDRPALRRRGPSGFEAITWAEYGRRVDRAAARLADLGVQPGDRVGIFSANRPEWHIADLAAMSLGAATVPVYTTSAPEQIAHVLGHSESRACFVEAELEGHLRAALPRLPALDHVIPIESVGAATGDTAPVPVEVGIDPDALATIVYTSGTTGAPKGTMLTHRNLAATVDAISAVVPIGPSDRFLSFLPLSHIAERIVSHFGQIASGGETWFAQSFTSVAEDLKECRPTIFFAVPRVWEKAHDAVEERIKSLPLPARLLAQRYVHLGAQIVDARQHDVPPGKARLVPYGALDRVLGRRIRRELGLDAARSVVSGAAPIAKELLVWFHAIGIPIAEVYGQTEDCGPATLNPADRIRIGTVGPPLPGLEVTIADDGEVLVRGPTVCAGYYRDDDGTSALIGNDGWMRTGDIGVVAADGYLTITGRKKDLIITAQGKNIAPQVIETRLRTCPLIAEAVVVGDQRPYLTALLALDPDAVVAWASNRGKPTDVGALSADPDLLAEVDRAVGEVNAVFSRVEQIKKWRLLPRGFTLDEGELTPTLKVRRHVVLEHHRDLVEAMYTE